MSSHLQSLVTLIGEGIDLAGVLVITVGLVWVTVLYLKRRRDTPADDAFRAYRQGIGRSILLGLEILVAGDIIRTVAIEPTLSSVAVLASIVAVRTFLSWSLEVELSGRWPWQKKSAG